MNQMKCRKCGNTAYLKSTGRQVGTAVGAAAGGTGAVAGATAIGATAGAATVGAATVGAATVGAASLKAGALAGSFLGPLGIVAGAGIGGLFGLLIGIGRGASSGYKVGEVIDRKVIGEYYCPHCGHTFKG